MFERKIDNHWSFRTANTKEFTHCYHAYPAMMIPQVARTLIEQYAPKGKFELLFDPYMGSGTSLVEAQIKGINSVGTDLNPLARFMAKVKTTHFDQIKIDTAVHNMWAKFFTYSSDMVEDKDFNRISNYSFWYSEDCLLKLSYINQIIRELDGDIQPFFQIALSEVVREASYTRNGEFKRFRIKADKIKDFNPDVFGLFDAKVSRNFKGLQEFNNTNKTAVATIGDFNTVENIPSAILQNNSVDMVVTSPPYGDSHTTVAYGQFSRWANEWFGFPNAKNLDNLLMGGKKQKQAIFQTETIKNELQEIENLDATRYSEVVSFLNDYTNSIENVAKTVRQGGRICYVVGNRTVKGIQIPLDYFTAETFEKQGFKHEITLVREIPNKRMPSQTSPTNKVGCKVATMSNEYIVIMTKE